jgi:hypothetical protein
MLYSFVITIPVWLSSKFYQCSKCDLLVPAGIPFYLSLEIKAEYEALDLYLTLTNHESHQICSLNCIGNDGFYLKIISIFKYILAQTYQWDFRVEICRDFGESDLHPRCCKEENLHAVIPINNHPLQLSWIFFDFTYIFGPLFWRYY